MGGLVVALLASAALAAADDPVLVYDFDQGPATMVTDRGPHHLDGRVENARFQRSGDGYALQCDGRDSRVVAGEPAALDLRETLTIEAWVKPDRLPATEVGIAGKGVTSYGLTYYTDGRAWFYISDGANNLKSALAPGYWYHLAGTYDGREMRLYVNGAVRDRRAQSGPVRSGKAFVVGDRSDEPGKVFGGLIDDVRVYSRALSEQEIADHYRASRRNVMVRRQPITAVRTLRGDGFTVSLGAGGGVQIDAGGERYWFETAFSYPGESIGWNTLSEEEPPGEAGWRPVVRQTATGWTVTAAGAQVSLEREIRLANGRLDLRDTIRNTGGEDVGVLVRHRVITVEEPRQVLLAGVPAASLNTAAENPTVLVELPASRLGLVAVDSVSRLQCQPRAYLNEAGCALNRLGLPPGAARTLRWSLYALPDAADYFDFINRVRDDWRVNYTIPGPWSFINLNQRWDLVEEPARLKRFLERNKLKIVAFAPWLDYDNMNDRTGKLVDRAEYRTMMRQAAAAFRAVDPTIRCTGCMEGNIVGVPEPLMQRLFDALPRDKRARGIYPMTEEQTKLVRGAGLPWSDCLLTGPDGRNVYELYYRGPNHKPMMAVNVYAAPGNGQARYWLDQARFMMDEVGLDGIYIDQFSLAWGNDLQRFSYEAWDNLTVDIDPQTGRITRRYTDAGYAGIGARVALADYVLGRGGVMVCNTNPAAEEMQAKPTPRFMEALWWYDPVRHPAGQEPPLLEGLCKGQLGAPIGLGYVPGSLKEDAAKTYAQSIMTSVMMHLRHGLLYYYYVSDIPEEGEGAGEYGPLNHMYPITPVSLHKGWIVGQERTVTAVSGRYEWAGKQAPKVLRFDLHGREIPPDATLTKHGAGWRVDLKLNDWREIAVVEG